MTATLQKTSFRPASSTQLPQCYQVGNALGKQDFNVRKIHYYIEVALFAGLFCNIRQSCRVLGSGGRTTKTILSDNVLIAIGSFF